MFAVSTYLYRQRRLVREHLAEIRAHGFDAIELYASRTHVDFHNAAVVADVQQWLAEARLELTSVHAPVLGASLASAETREREQALAETERALHIGRRIPFRTFVVHLGRPRIDGVRGGLNRDAARRSVDALVRAADPLGVRIAVEVIGNDLSRAESLAELVDVLDDDVRDRAGICLDLGHARLDGDVADAIETTSGHLLSVDVHDTRGRADDHLVPFDGAIDWAQALTAVRKVGYDGPLTFELAPRGSTKETLARATQARRRMDDLLQAGMSEP